MGAEFVLTRDLFDFLINMDVNQKKIKLNFSQVILGHTPAMKL